MEERLTLDMLIKTIQSDNPDERTAAWLAAGAVGASAIKPLARIVAEGDLEVARAAKRALWKIVRTAGAPGAPGATDAKDAVEAELIGVLGEDALPEGVHCEVLWMLSEVGGDAAVAAIREIPDLLKKPRLREDARSAVERIPGAAAIQALKDALEDAPDDFKPAVAQSLRARGVEVDPQKYPCQKLVPTKQTSVKPVSK